MIKMNRILLKKWFVIILCLKLISSTCAWLLPFIGVPSFGVLSLSWVFGLFVPIILMLIYIIIGFARRIDAGEASDESFADSCYYLGFIFTISSIIFTLFDLNNLDNRLNEVVMRFGAAMLCTVIGLIVRIYLIGFKSVTPNEKLEQRLSLATDRYCMQIDRASLKFEDMGNKAQSSLEYLTSLLSKTIMEFGVVNQKNIEQQQANFESLQTSYATNIDKFSKSVELLLSSSKNSIESQTSIISSIQKAHEKRIEHYLSNYESFFKDSKEMLATHANQAENNIAQINQQLDKLNAPITKFSTTLDHIDKNLENTLSQMDNFIQNMPSKIDNVFENIQHNLLNNSQKLFDESKNCIEQIQAINETIALLPNILIENTKFNIPIQDDLNKIQQELTNINNNTKRKRLFFK